MRGVGERKVGQINSSTNMQSLAAAIWQTRQTGYFSGEVHHLCKDGRDATPLVDFSLLLDANGAEIGIIIAAYDMSYNKVTEKLRELALGQGARDTTHIEDKVRESALDIAAAEAKLREYSRRLEQANEARKLLIGQISDQQERLEKGISRNLNAMVWPILDQLRAEKLPESSRLLLQSLEFNLRSIFSSFDPGRIPGADLLTPREIRVCELVRSGLSSKEAAEIMGIALATVETHRANIRKKLGSLGLRGNLSTQLRSEREDADSLHNVPSTE